MAATIRDAGEAIHILRQTGRQDLSSSIEQALQSIQAERFVIGVIGATKRGKSTLVNGLLGRQTDDCAPIGRKPATSVISIFGRGSAAECRVCFHGGSSQAISESEIRLYATEEHNKGNFKQVRSIECIAPFEGLEPGMFLVDTPGAGNALEEMHNEILLGFLPNADAVVFMVTAEEPLTESELSLLRAVRAKDIKKIFFAINMVDRVSSGDLDADALAQGIQHNRTALASLEGRNGDKPYAAVKLYTISAKRFHETQRDPGTEELIRDIRASIRDERLIIITQKLRERVQATLEECEACLAEEVREAKISDADIRIEIAAIQKARKELDRGRLGRETEFRREWSDAFSSLADSLAGIRQQLHSEYAQKIENTSALKLGSLASTIHADVAASFGELLTRHIKDCEDKITLAQRKLHDQVFQTAVQICPQLHGSCPSLSRVKSSLEAGVASLPSLVTGAVAATLPGWISSMVLSAAPAVASITWSSPISSGLAAAGTFIANSTVQGVGAFLGTTLAVVATPLSIIAFGVSAYRFIDTWRSQQDKSKNELAVSVRHLIDDAHKQALDQLTVYRNGDMKLLCDYQQVLNAELARLEDGLESALARKPDQAAIKVLEDKHQMLTAHRSKLLQNVNSNGDRSSNPNSPVIADALLNKY